MIRRIALISFISLTGCASGPISNLPLQPISMPDGSLTAGAVHEADKASVLASSDGAKYFEAIKFTKPSQVIQHNPSLVVPDWTFQILAGQLFVAHSDRNGAHAYCGQVVAINLYPSPSPIEWCFAISQGKITTFPGQEADGTTLSGDYEFKIAKAFVGARPVKFKHLLFEGMNGSLLQFRYEEFDTDSIEARNAQTFTAPTNSGSFVNTPLGTLKVIKANDLRISYTMEPNPK